MRAFGFPDVRGEVRTVLAVLIDTIGAGAFWPLTFLYFIESTSLPVDQIGLALSSATLLSFSAAPLAGRATDRWGARRALMVSNVLAAAGYVSYVATQSWGTIFCAVLLVMTADRLYWASWPVLVSEIARRDQLDAWYAMVHAVKSGCIGLGALIASLVIALMPTHGFDLLLYANAGSSLLAAALIARRSSGQNAQRRQRHHTGSLLTLARDRPFRSLVVAQFAVSFALIVPTVALPVFLTDELRLPHWVVTMVFAVNTVLILLLQTAVIRRLSRFTRTRVVAVSAVVLVASIALIWSVGFVPEALAIPWIIAAVVVFSCGEMACLPPANALAISIADPTARGLYSSIFQSAGAAAWALGPGVVGLLLTVGPTALWAALALVVSVGGYRFFVLEVD